MKETKANIILTMRDLIVAAVFVIAWGLSVELRF